MTTAQLTPVERLNLSRQHLRLAMTPTDAPPNTDTSTGTATGRKPVGLELFDLVKLAVPSAGMVIDAAKLWWSGHPLQASGNLVEGVADELLRPLARRHPLTLVAGAVAVGALLVWIRPWRWVLKAHLLKTWGPAVLSSAVASSAVQSWLLAVLAKNAAPQQQAPHQAQPPSAQPVAPAQPPFHAGS